MPDNVVRHRPFWSFSIIMTEKWLGEMASSGLIFVSTDFKGKFVFEVSKPQKLNFCFVYNKFDSSSKHSKSAKKEWQRIAHKQKWGLYQSISGTNKNLPNRRGLFLRNNSLLCLYAFTTSAILLVLMMCSFFGISINRQDADYETNFRLIILTIGIFAIIILLNFIFYLNMASANRNILKNEYDDKLPNKAYKNFINSKTFEKWLEKMLIKEGDITKCIRIIWLFTPTQIEKWLMKMQSYGYNFYKLSKRGIVFYFTKGVSKKLSYRVVSGESEIIEDCMKKGWQVVFSGTKILSDKNIIAIISSDEVTSQNNLFLDTKESENNKAKILSSYAKPYMVFLILVLMILMAIVIIKLPLLLFIIVSFIGIFDLYLIAKILIYYFNRKNK